MAQTDDPEKYEQDQDSYVREIVGSWVKDKHARLEKYVGISRSVRKGFVGASKAGATYIDLFSGPGRVRIRDRVDSSDGSPLIAWNQSVEGGFAFTQVHVADADPNISLAANERLKLANAPVRSDTGPATETVDRVIKNLHPSALHFAFLDPYNLKSLPFEVIKKLAGLKRMDILIHVSIQDLQRNLQRYIDAENHDSPLDTFAPGWRAHVEVNRSHKVIRTNYLEYWKGLLKSEDMTTAETFELVSGPSNQSLYLLAFAARHERALEFWEKIRDLDGNKQGSLF